MSCFTKRISVFGKSNGKKMSGFAKRISDFTVSFTVRIGITKGILKVKRDGKEELGVGGVTPRSVRCRYTKSLPTTVTNHTKNPLSLKPRTRRPARRWDDRSSVVGETFFYKIRL